MENSIYDDDIENVVLLEISELMNQTADKIKDELYHQKKILSPDALFERKQLEIKESIQSIKKECSRLDEAFNIFEKNKYRFLETSEIQKVFNEIQTIGLHLNKEAVLNTENFKEKTLQEIFEISNFVLYSFYRVGRGLFQEKLFPASSNIFFFLTILSPFVKDYWLAYGAAEKLNDHFEDALYAYAMASLMDINDPEPHIIAAECYISLRELDPAQAEIDEAKNIIRRIPDSKPWLEHVEAVQAHIEKFKNEAIK